MGLTHVEHLENLIELVVSYRGIFVADNLFLNLLFSLGSVACNVLLLYAGLYLSVAFRQAVYECYHQSITMIVRPVGVACHSLDNIPNLYRGQTHVSSIK